MRVIVLLGPPGSGKGTQADVLCRELGAVHVASGDLFRSEIQAGTALGREAKSYVDRGALVPDAITVRMVMDRLSRPDAQGGVILDGFPRTAQQAEALDRALDDRGTRVDHAIYLDVSTPELVRRLSARWVCPNGHVYNTISQPPRVEGVCDVDGLPLEQREDDRPDVVRERLVHQLAPLYEVVDHYRHRGILSVVDGTQTVDQVTEEILRALRVGSRAA
jgi:adenylate kinase